MTYGATVHRFMVRLSLAATAALIAIGMLAGPSSAADKWVTMYDSKYLPGPVTIRPGDTVTWVNDDDLPHDAVGNGWSTPLLNKGDSHAVTFTKAGTYRYTCTIHPAMSSRVIVRAASGGSGATTPPTSLAAPEMLGKSTDSAGIAMVAAAGAVFGLVVLRTRRRGLR
jgi:plastocyanin